MANDQASRQSGGQFVEATVFLQEMTSRRSLERCDEAGAEVRGLFDPETGRRILVTEKSLFEAMENSD